MDEPQRERDPESYFATATGLFTDGLSERPRSPPPATPSVATVTEPAREIPVHEETDVLVVGGGPAGTAAAVAAARLGQRVTLVRGVIGRRPVSKARGSCLPHHRSACGGPVAWPDCIR